MFIVLILFAFHPGWSEAWHCSGAVAGGGLSRSVSPRAPRLTTVNSQAGLPV